MLFRKGNIIKPGQIRPVKYGFTAGTLVQRMEVEYWLDWLSYNYGYEFELVEDYEGVTINWSDDAWTSSFTGLEGYNMTLRQSPWNINFNPAYYSNGYAYQRYSIGHEIVHSIIGAEHGMKNPNGPAWLPLDERAVLLRDQGYSELFISQHLAPINPDDYIITPFDQHSFMDYPIDCAYTHDGQLCGNLNMVPSNQDLRDIGQVIGQVKECYIGMEEWDLINGYPFKDARLGHVGFTFSKLPTFKKYGSEILAAIES